MPTWSLRSSEVIVFQKRVSADVIKVKIERCGHPGLGWALNPMVSVLIRDRERTQRDRGGKPREESDDSTSQEMSWLAGATGT